MGALAGPSEEEGGVVFSLSFGACTVRSLLDRFILLNIPVKFVDDLDFFGADNDSLTAFLDDCMFVRSLLVCDVGILFCRLFDGDIGGDCVFPCLSPRTLDLVAACGWSGGSSGTTCVLAFAMEELLLCTFSIGRELGETNDFRMFAFEDAFRRCCGRVGGTLEAIVDDIAAAVRHKY